MYLALYRKYRPKTFDDVISQPHITTTLKNQITTGKTAHAYLFTGSRGTGKTTCSKIFAMAVNCLSPINGNPCMECEACREIDSGATTDIVEMDAASNNSVDDVRMLRDEVAYTPVSCKYRVYIIDEVHMMSTQAFNALLKTLEEPPAHVKFILATTELHKVPTTILSRCQRFEFRRIDINESAARLMQVAQTENITLSEEAAQLISRLSDGGMRDALSVLDRCIAADRNVTADIVRSCAGVADNHHLYRFAELIAARDVSGCIRLLDELYRGSKDITRVIDELSGTFRDIMLCKTVPEEKELLSAMPDDHPVIEQLCEVFPLEEILRCLSLLQQCSDSMSKTRQRKTVAEMCMVKMCMGISAESGSPERVKLSSQPAQPIKPRSEPMGNEFAPIPDSKLSKQSAANLNKLHETLAQAASHTAPQSTVKPAQAAPADPAALPSAPAEATQPKTEAAPVQEPEYIPAPELNSAPAAMPDFAPPPLDIPPEEFIPQQEFETAPSPQESLPKATPAPAASKQEEPVQEDIKPAAPPPQAEEATPAEPVEVLVPKAGKLMDISPEKWRSTVEQLNGMFRYMLNDSTAQVAENGVLEISSGNLLLHNQVTEKGYQDIEAELSKVLGTNVHAQIVGMAVQEKTAADDTNRTVKQLLEKARQLNIEIQIK